MYTINSSILYLQKKRRKIFSVDVLIYSFYIILSLLLKPIQHPPKIPYSVCSAFKRFPNTLKLLY